MNLIQKYQRASVPKILHGFGILSPPIPINGLSKGLGIQVLGPGTTQNTPYPSILLKDLPEPDMRLHAAKDLGTLLGHTDTEQFALEILMPEFMVKFSYAKLSKNVEELANLFKVPPTVMSERMKALRMIMPCP